MKPLLALTSQITLTLLCLLAGSVGILQAQENMKTLQEAFADHFFVGAALETNTIRNEGGEFDYVYENILPHFNQVTAENCMKPKHLQPREGEFNFAEADKLVEFAEKHGKRVIGHTLVWHNGTPDWFFGPEKDGTPVDREILLRRMKHHIDTVVGRYKGRVHGWDVVNEAIAEGGEDELRKTKWRQIIGDDYLEHAFRFAHEADPEAKLYYNDYSMFNKTKRERVIRLINGLREKGVPIHGVGIQGHWKIDGPGEKQIRETIEDFSGLGLEEIMITELDLSVLPHPGGVSAEVNNASELAEEDAARLNPYADGLPPEIQEKLAKRYADVFRIFVEYDKVITRVTFWNTHDRTTWRHHHPMRGRTDYPLLFDHEGKPKPALDAVLAVGQE